MYLEIETGEIFQDDVAAAAIGDRLLSHCYPFLINGESSRLKNITKSKLLLLVENYG
ncbi:MAG: ATP-binding protein [Ignavibacteriales bacterium]